MRRHYPLHISFCLWLLHFSLAFVKGTPLTPPKTHSHVDTQTGLEKREVPKPLKITCLTIGSRGDVQPYIALCHGLQADGHICTIATHAEFEGMVKEAGIGFRSIGGDPKELMKHCVEYDSTTPAFYWKGFSKFKVWLKELLKDALEACEGTEVLIESPTAMVGVHIAESMRIPYIRAFTMPWTKTSSYPQSFALSKYNVPKWLNRLGYTVFDWLVWRGIALFINPWRKKVLNLEPMQFRRLHSMEIPILYNFSEQVVPKPKDWGKSVHITGYWFLDQAPSPSKTESQESSIDPALRAFIQRGKDNGKKIVYIGFGSVIFPDAKKIQETIENAVAKADVWAVVSGGWSEMRHETKVATPNSAVVGNGKEPTSEIHYINAAPHDWLFARVDAALHHGGAGTTGASIRAGIPTLIKPFFGDQYFWAKRVNELGIGTHLKSFDEDELAEALRKATTDQDQIQKAREKGELVRGENGVRKAIDSIYEELEKAKARERTGGQGLSPDGKAPSRALNEPKPSMATGGVDHHDKLHQQLPFIAYYTIISTLRTSQLYSMHQRNQHQDHSENRPIRRT